uniref:Fatty acyl-CoA reductase n=1 Tax=Timema genevievae TaxID=629358 RepID=A0A7R9K3J5_TIMGE|nr:unnamed protein product [Timema genevievae]
MRPPKQLANAPVVLSQTTEDGEIELFDRLKSEKPGFVSRLTPLRADVSLENAGLSPEDRRRLQEEVNVVFHCAANVRFDQKLKDAVNLNTLGTRRVLQLCEGMTNLLYTRLGSSHDLPVIGSLVNCRSNALDHAATEVGLKETIRKINAARAAARETQVQRPSASTTQPPQEEEIEDVIGNLDQIDEAIRKANAGTSSTSTTSEPQPGTSGVKRKNIPDNNITPAGKMLRSGNVYPNEQETNMDVDATNQLATTSNQRGGSGGRASSGGKLHIFKPFSSHPDPVTLRFRKQFRFRSYAYAWNEFDVRYTNSATPAVIETVAIRKINAARAAARETQVQRPSASTTQPPQEEEIEDVIGNLDQIDEAIRKANAGTSSTSTTSEPQPGTSGVKRKNIPDNNITPAGKMLRSGNVYPNEQETNMDVDATNQLATTSNQRGGSGGRASSGGKLHIFKPFSSHPDPVTLRFRKQFRFRSYAYAWNEFDVRYTNSATPAVIETVGKTVLPERIAHSHLWLDQAQSWMTWMWSQAGLGVECL